MQKIVLLLLGLAALIMAASCVIILYPRFGALKRKPLKPAAYSAQWKNISLFANVLPKDSTVTTTKNTTNEFEVSLSPTINSTSQGTANHSLHISVSIKEVGGDESFPKKCVTPVVQNDLHVDPFYTGLYQVKITHSVSTHSTGPYSNPNPYTPEVEETLKAVIGGMRIGYCV